MLIALTGDYGFNDGVLIDLEEESLTNVTVLDFGNWMKTVEDYFKGGGGVRGVVVLVCVRDGALQYKHQEWVWLWLVLGTRCRQWIIILKVRGVVVLVCVYVCWRGVGTPVQTPRVGVAVVDYWELGKDDY